MGLKLNDKETKKKKKNTHTHTHKAAEENNSGWKKKNFGLNIAADRLKDQAIDSSKSVREQSL